MKTLRLILSLIILSSISCKKDTSARSDIIGKWKLQYIKSKISIRDSIVDSLTINATNGDYIDFREDSKAYSNSWIAVGFNSEHKIEVTSHHNLDTNFYKVINDKLIGSKNNKSDTISIFQLTNSSLIIGLDIKLFKVDTNISIDSSNYIIWNTKNYYTK